MVWVWNLAGCGQQGKAGVAQCDLIQGFLAYGGEVLDIAALGQPYHGGKAGLVARAGQAEFVGLAGAGDVVYKQLSFTREAAVELRQYGGAIAVEVCYVYVGHGLKDR